ncbi:MAG: TetR/AcrR family transcriptional regulator [Gemmatimonadales bacterium]
MDVRQRLLDAAAKLYAEVGYRGATTRRIAQEAGVNELSLFRHFGSKGELLHTAIGACRPGSMDFSLPVVPVDPVAELGEWVTRRVAVMREHQGLIRTALGEAEEHPELIRPSEAPMVQAGAALSVYLGRLRERGFTSAEFDPGAAASLLLSTLFVDAIVRDVMPGAFGPDAERDAAEYLRIFLRGVGVEIREPVRKA